MEVAPATGPDLSLLRHDVRRRLTRAYPLPTGRLPTCRGRSEAVDAPTVVQDERSIARDLVPLDVLREVTDPDLAAIDDMGAGELQRVNSARYVAVHHVLDYATPKLVYSLRKNRRVWKAGRFVSRLAIHDLAERTAACAETVHVQSDTTDATTRVRAMSATREALVGDLGRALSQATRESLGRPEVARVAQNK